MILVSHHPGLCAFSNASFDDGIAALGKVLHLEFHSAQTLGIREEGTIDVWHVDAVEYRPADCTVYKGISAVAGRSEISENRGRVARWRRAR